MEGEALGRIIEHLYRGKIEKLTPSARWSEEDKEQVKGMTTYLIGGQLGTQGEFGKILLEEAQKYLDSEIPEQKIKLLPVSRENVKTGIMGAAFFVDTRAIEKEIKDLPAPVARRAFREQLRRILNRIILIPSLIVSFIFPKPLYQKVLDKNDIGRYLVPSQKLYGHQWLWDSCFHAIVLAKFDPERAKREIFALFDEQWENGFVPHIRFNPGYKNYRPNAEDWATGHPTTGITQPPVIALAALRVYQETGDKEFLRQVFPKIVQYHRWLKTSRDPLNHGLLAIVHPWESGMDNSPLWDRLRDRILRSPRFDKFVQGLNLTFRVDDKIIPSEERPRDKDYHLYWGLIEFFKSLGWNHKEMVEQSPFLVEDVAFNALWTDANESLAEIARILGEEPAEFLQWSEQTREAVREKLWDEDDGLFYDFDLKHNKKIKVKTVGAFLPLFSRVPTPEIAQRLVAHLNNEREFRAPAGVPSTSMDEEGFERSRYWRGPVWLNMHWFLIQGLRNYGYYGLANELVKKSRDLVSQSGYWEFYDPINGKGQGVNDFSWSTLQVDMEIEKGLHEKDFINRDVVITVSYTHLTLPTN